MNPDVAGLTRNAAGHQPLYPAGAGDSQLPQMHLLIVDDDPPVRHACAEIAAGLGFVTLIAESVPAAHAVLARSPIDLVLLDLKLPGGGGLPLLEEIRSKAPDTVVVVMTAFATVNSAVEAMRIGAGDYLTKPFSLEELSTVLERAAHRRAFDAESRTLRERLRSGKGMGNLIGSSPAMEKLYRILSKVANTTHPVLILGEAGTGKELVARTIHGNGPTAEKPFIAVDCASVLPSLIEAELFGYVKGAAPANLRSPASSKIGLLAAADGGTVFLDEIAELPLDLQTRLLRALQDREVRPIGGITGTPTNVRILAATNHDLLAMVETGRFRKDLYFRLNIVSLHIPPLRERMSDVPLLSAHVLDRIRRDNGLAYTFADDALRLLMEYNWPGNVRELEHSIERACALSSGPVLHLGDFPTQLQNHREHMQHRHEPATPAPSAVIIGALPKVEPHVVLSIAELERQAILNTIRELKGDKLMAARLLGIGKTTLYRKLKEYGLSDDL
ncbi:sigma-54 dependent transcriptional regulator [Granulicella sp. 5B5]|uniref:sigma-54-dependent transcriptional regulator n=1 Tax=Granulicella sp. 5B5 TaxID=1617967 RepID=UPI00210263FA|nr:sigma-54 dependent transcriptional regulator [Granulicella sp. 5B5]